MATPWSTSLLQQLRGNHDIGGAFPIPTGNDVDGQPYQFVLFSCPLDLLDAANTKLILMIYFDFSWDNDPPQNWVAYDSSPFNGGTINVHTGAYNIPAFSLSIPVNLQGQPAKFARVRIDPRGNQANYGANIAAKSIGG
ncbi:MAG: hypothetical protein KGL39_33385 [Patescibacteria group bacterium]|nr:hypothetical protein [Patescibacteria group bacterium]